MITASHNPPEYNGYKVFGEDGAQLAYPHDIQVMEEVSQVKEIPQTTRLAKLHLVGEELDQAYLRENLKLQTHKAGPLKIIYTPLHGTGIRIVPQALKSWGYPDLHLVKKQSAPDGDFPFAKKPNPEEKKSMALGIEQLLEEKGDILIATDPDADRLGVVIPDHPFTGNQIACLLLHHICKTGKKGTCIKTIVTSELFRKIGEKEGNICLDVLTGFKYIGEKIRELENSPSPYFFGAEESCGYLSGTFVRDKDAVSSACLVAEMADLLKQQGKTLLDQLHLLYQEYGVHRESLVNIAFSDSAEGMGKMKQIMTDMRQNTPKTVLGQKVVKVEDFLPGIHSLPPSDVLRLWLEDESKIVVRPSGTEPKVKIYLEVVSKNGQDVASQIKDCDEKRHQLTEFFESLKTTSLPDR